MQLSVTNSFAPSTTISSAGVNQNFTDVETWANGGIQTDNFDTFSDEVDWSITSSTHAINISGNSSANSALVNITQAGAAQGIKVAQSGASPAVELSQSSTAAALKITQTGSGGTNKAAVDIASTTSGVLMPRMTSTQRDAISSPPEGLEIYNSTQKCKQFYNGSGWTNMGAQTGQLIHLGTDSATPVGYLPCDGSAVSRSTYADLFAVVSTNFGAGNGTTTFNVPDTRRQVLMGSGGTQVAGPTNAVGSQGGGETHQLTSSEMPSHSHSVNDSGHHHSVSTCGNGGDNHPGQPAYNGNGLGTAGAYFSGVATSDISINSAGSDGFHDNVQPSLVVGMFIKF